MANLNVWQKLTRVIPGCPFGSGVDGAYSSATILTLTKDSCSGTASSTTLTTAGSTFANGDILLIHQTRGTGVGQWEIGKVASGGGSTSLTLSTALNYTFTDSGVSQAQAIKIPQYTNVTVQSGTWTIPAWDKNVGGLFVIAANGTVTVTGTTTGNSKGFNKPTSQSGVGTGSGTGSTNYAGEGSTGDEAQQTTANGNAGGGGLAEGTAENAKNSSGGGGGANGAVGTQVNQNGYDSPSQGAQNGGGAGATSGAADLTTFTFGGAGGWGGRSQGGTNNPNNPGNGGGAVLIFAKDINVTGGITANGENGANQSSANDRASSGAGAGGSILIICKTATLGSNLITATGGTGGVQQGYGGAGGDGGTGRIAIHHSGTVTGTTNPTFGDTSDTTLRSSEYGGIL